MKDVTNKTINEVVSQSKLPIVIDFSANWCAPCRSIQPHLEAISNDLKGKVNIVKINIDNNAVAASELGVISIPTLILFNNGKEVSRVVGGLPKSRIMTFIKDALHKTEN